MTTLPNPSPRDESTDHIPETGSATPRDSTDGTELQTELKQAHAELMGHKLRAPLVDLEHDERLVALKDELGVAEVQYAILRAELDNANLHNDELRGVIQRQGGRVDREHAGLVAQVTRLTTELDTANLYNDELRAIVAGRSNQVEDELDEALRVGANYRTKVAALFTELGEAIDLLEAVSAEADSYADRLKARGAA